MKARVSWSVKVTRRFMRPVSVLGFASRIKHDGAHDPAAAAAPGALAHGRPLPRPGHHLAGLPAPRFSLRWPAGHGGPPPPARARPPLAVAGRVLRGLRHGRRGAAGARLARGLPR